MNLTATAIAYLSLAWAVWIVILASGETLISRPRVRAESLDASLIRLTARLIAIGAAGVLVFKGATAIGIPLMGLVASVSIGGLAVALAAQDTLKKAALPSSLSFSHFTRHLMRVMEQLTKIRPRPARRNARR